MNLSRKELEKKQRREYILSCAEKLFAEKGFDGVTVAEIASASEFSVGSLYLFFKNKESLVKELIIDRLRTIGEIIREQAENDEAPEIRLEKMIFGLTDLFIEHFEFFKVLMLEVKKSEICCPSDEMWMAIKKSHQDNVENGLKVFKAGIDEGLIREDINPTFMALTLDGLMHTMVSYSINIDKNVSLSDMRDGMVEIYYRGILKREKSRRKKG